MVDTDQVLKLAAIIREVDGSHSKGAAFTLAELILNHPSFCECYQPEPPADGDVAKSVAWLRQEFVRNQQIGNRTGALQSLRAAELLQRQAPVPVAVSDALIKAECALSDISEGEHNLISADALQWAERRCADTLAIIRPTMRQHKIRTSEWPPVPAHALPLPEVNNG